MVGTALIVGATDEEELGEILTPYLESRGSEPDGPLRRFCDIEDFLLKSYESKIVDAIVMPDGQLTFASQATPPEQIRKVSAKEIYKTFELFADLEVTSICLGAGVDPNSFCQADDADGRDSIFNRYGYWSNPNDKFDWCLIGGKFSPFFQLKNGRKGLVGDPHKFGFRTEPTTGRADHALKGDIDFEAMRSEAARLAARTYDAVAEAIKGTPMHESWEVISALYPDETVEPRKSVPAGPITLRGLIESAKGKAIPESTEAWKKYCEQPRIKAFHQFRATEKGRELLRYSYSFDDFNIPRAQYIQQKRDDAGATGAVVMYGHWYDLYEEYPQTWRSIHADIVDRLPDEEILTMVDYHF